MQLVDANVLLYAVDPDLPQHAPARGWLDGALAGAEPVGFAWIVLLAFLRLATHPGVFPRPLTVDEAAGVVELWLSQPPSVVVEPTGRHLALLRGLDRLAALGFPVLLGVSRKRFIRAIDPAAEDPEDRLGGSLAAALWGAAQGVAAVRVHDVRQTVQALKVWAAIGAAGA